MRKRAWWLAALSGGLQVLIFPTPDLYWLGWVAFAPLLLAILCARRAEVEVASSWGVKSWRPASPGQAFLLGWLSGALWYAGSCYWIEYTMRAYGGLATPIAAGVLVLFCLYLGAHRRFCPPAGAGRFLGQSAYRRAAGPPAGALRLGCH
jgi:apolipoprotein N-acyltransferase